MSAEDAIKTAEAALSASASSDQPTSLAYLALSDSSVALTHVVRVQDDKNGIAVDAYVDAHTNKLISIVNFVTNLTVSLSSFLHSDDITRLLALQTVSRASNPRRDPYPRLPRFEGPRKRRRLAARLGNRQHHCECLVY